MTIPVKKLHNGFQMPVFGLGTWQMGGRMERNLANNDEVDIQGIRNAIEAGITHIDTAEGYAAGHTETLVGQAIKNYRREKLFLVSKVSKEHLSHDDLRRSIEASLKRLQVDYLDLYLLHAPSQVVPIQETMRTMDELLEQGLIKSIGVSNFTVNQMKLAQENSNYQIVANQLHLNLMYRETEQAGLLDYCQKHDVMFVAWRPLQKGVLLQEGGELLKQLAEKYHKTPAQIAINWLIAQPNVVTLAKTADAAHLAENLGAIGWELSAADVELLRTAFPNQKSVSDAVPLKEWT